MIEPSPQAVELTMLLVGMMRENNERCLMRDSWIPKWEREADLLLRVDKRPFEEAREVLRWCQHDSFWMINIRSMGKFREQYDRLYMKWRGSNGNGHRSPDVNAAHGYDPKKDEQLQESYARLRKERLV